METMGSALSCSARCAMERGEDQTEEEDINTCNAGVAIATEDTLTPVWHDIRESSTSRKRSRRAAGYCRCGLDALDEAAKDCPLGTGSRSRSRLRREHILRK